jgi:Domain of unknown function (DUF4440)
LPKHLLTLLLLAAACHKGPKVEVDPAPPSLDPQRLTEVLEAQFQRSAADWNAGNLRGFMSDYANDSTTMYRAGPRFEYGFAWIENHYAPLFVSGARRDSLRFESFAARPLGTTYALVTARYVLYRNGVTSSSGLFSLVMQERTDGWKIILDHTSSDPR